MDAATALEPFLRPADPAWFRVEGRWNVEAALRNGFPLERIVVVRGQHGEWRDQVAGTGPSAVPVHEVGRDELSAVLGFPFHRGVLALARRPEPRSLWDGEIRFPVLVAADLADASNLGAMVRSAAALGAGMMVVPAGRGADPFSPKAVRASSGAMFRLPVVASPVLGEDLDRLGNEGVRVFGASSAAGLPRDIRDVDPGERWVLLLGSEGNGLGEEWAARCREFVRIPMQPGEDSLNVATAAAIILWQWRGSGPSGTTR